MEAGAKKQINSYRDLTVWQKGMDLIVVCYELSNHLPADETYGLKSQIRRAAVSVPANIAEGFGRRHLGEYVHHLSIANGSLKELETHLLAATRLKFLRPEQIQNALNLCEEIGRMLLALIKKLRSKAST